MFSDQWKIYFAFRSREGFIDSQWLFPLPFVSHLVVWSNHILSNHSLSNHHQYSVQSVQVQYTQDLGQAILSLSLIIYHLSLIVH